MSKYVLVKLHRMKMDYVQHFDTQGVTVCSILYQIAEMPCQKFVITTTGTSCTWVRCGARINSGSDAPEEYSFCIPCNVRKRLEKK